MPGIFFYHLVSFFITTLTELKKTKIEGVAITIIPSALHAYCTGLQTFPLEDATKV